MDLNVTIAIGSGTGILTSQIPMSSNGIFTLNGTFTNFGINLSDLNFLVGNTSFSTLFPTTLPTSWYTSGSTALNLLSLGVTLYINTTPTFSVTVSSITVSIGIVNIPLYPNGLFLNPLAVWMNITSPTNNPTVDCGLSASAMLYPFGKQTHPPSAPADFTFDMDLQLPSSSDSTFSISGLYDNPNNLPVSNILSDLMNNGSFNTGIGNQITLENFDFFSTANVSSGSITSFSTNIGMSSPIGLFANADLGTVDFKISVDYNS